MSGRKGEITAQTLLKAYAIGIFPMAESRDDPSIYWIDPDKRGVIPLESFHVPTRLRRTVRSDFYSVTINSAFPDVIEGCAAPGAGRSNSWINKRVRDLYVALHRLGHAHSVEVYEGNVLVGGLYGVSLGGAFFGESMFSRARDASKVALVHLVARLKFGGYVLLDTQFITDHLRQFGAIEIPRADYQRRLKGALLQRGDFYSLRPEGSLGGVPGGAASGGGVSSGGGGSSGGAGVSSSGISRSGGLASATGSSVLQLTTHTS
jgi:leucyl/phenylalanyl-tRNA---protein transferase